MSTTLRISNVLKEKLEKLLLNLCYLQNLWLGNEQAIWTPGSTPWRWWKTKGFRQS
jgi:hypothetical protein